MKRIKFTVKNLRVEPCPECGNVLEFFGCSERCAEDCCSCWVTCTCGYDPTGGHEDFRLEDVMGEVSLRTVPTMLEIWNDMVRKEGSHEKADQSA
jgi:hypothetical protein